MSGVIKSFNEDEDEILLGIMNLHCGGQPFDCEPTYSRGGFYRSGRVPKPEFKFDKSPVEGTGAVQADVKHLPLADSSLGSVVFDPPFIFNPHGTARAKNAAGSRYTMFDTWDDLAGMYCGALDEFRRVLRPKGILAFKCQDYTDSKTTMTHCHVWQWATERGFYAKDIFIRFRHFGPAYNPALRQKHARKFHSYWYVFENTKKE